MDVSRLSQLINDAATLPIDANTIMLLAMVFMIIEERDFGLKMHGKALLLHQLYHLPATAADVGIGLLAILRFGDMTDNTPLDFLLEGSDVSLDMLSPCLCLLGAWRQREHDWPDPPVLPKEHALQFHHCQGHHLRYAPPQPPT